MPIDNPQMQADAKIGWNLAVPAKAESVCVM